MMITSFIDWLFKVDDFSLTAAAGAQLLHVGTGLLLAWYHGLHKLRDGLAWKAGQQSEWPFLDEVKAAGFPLAQPSAWLATAAQLGGGLCLAAGLMTRPMALVLTGTLLGAFYTTRVLRKDSQMALVYLLLVVSVALIGPGPWSLDAILLLKP